MCWLRTFEKNTSLGGLKGVKISRMTKITGPWTAIDYEEFKKIGLVGIQKTFGRTDGPTHGPTRHRDLCDGNFRHIVCVTRHTNIFVTQNHCVTKIYLRMTEVYVTIDRPIFYVWQRFMRRLTVHIFYVWQRFMRRLTVHIFYVWQRFMRRLTVHILCDCTYCATSVCMTNSLNSQLELNFVNQ